MSTTTADRATARSGGHSAAAAHGRGAILRVLLRQRLRRDRWQLLIWILCIAFLALFSAASIDQT